MEEKARKKQFKQRSSLENATMPAGVSPTRPPATAGQLQHAAVYTTQQLAQHIHPAHIQPQRHRPVDPAEAAVHVARAAQAAAAHAAAAAAAAAQHHRAQIRDSAISQAVDANSAAANVAAAAIQVQLTNSAKRTRLEMEGAAPQGAADDAVDAVAAAAAAVAHAAATANPSESQFAPAVPIAAGPTVSTAATTQPLAPNTSTAMAMSPEHDDEAQRKLLEQLEAQRRWREEKRREIALKKAKGASSKRGRKKARVQAPSPVRQPHQVDSAPQLIPGSVAFTAGNPANPVVAAMDHHTSAGLSHAHMHMVPDDPTALYVRSAPSHPVAGQEEGGHAVQHGELEIAEQGSVEKSGTLGRTPDDAHGKAAVSDSSQLEDPSRATMTHIPGKGSSSEGPVSLHDNPNGIAPAPVADGNALLSKGETTDAVKDDIGKVEGVGTTAVAESDDKIAGSIAQATAQATADAAAATAHDARALRGGERGTEGIAGVANETTASDIAIQLSGHIAVGTGTGTVTDAGGGPPAATATEGTAVDGTTEGPVGPSAVGTLETGVGGEGDKQAGAAVEVRAEKPEDTQESFPVDGGEDIMTAAAWQSLDSISHT